MNITSTETETGWTITIDGDVAFTVNFDQVRRLHAYMERLVEPSERKSRIRNMWKQIVMNGLKTRRDDGSQSCNVQQNTWNDEPMIMWKVKRTDMTMTSSEFVSALRKEDQPKAIEFFNQFRQPT